MATVKFHTSLQTLRKPLSPNHPTTLNPISTRTIHFPNPHFTIKKTLTHLRSAAAAAAAASDTTTAPKTLKTRLNDGETLYGLFLLSFSPILAEIAGLAGYDYVVVDMEHGYGGVSAALPCLHALAATKTPAILRLPESSATWAKKALDVGPQGIMFPMIDTPKSAKKAVSYCRYPPGGVRGSAHTVIRASDYGINADAYLNTYSDDLLIICQVETLEGVKKIEEIAAVDGVDCVQMGPLDLSASMGFLWDPRNKKVKEVLREAEKGVLKKKEAYLGGFSMPHDLPESLRSRGYHMVAGAVDIGLFRTCVVEDVRSFKMTSMEDEVRVDVKNGDDKYWSE